MLFGTCTEHSEVSIMLRNELRQYHPRRASRIIFLRWQISRGRKKERVAWTNTSYEKHKRGRRTGASKAPERTCQPGGSTENDDRPLFPPSGLNYYHPAEHCLLWRRIILLSLGRPDSNTLGEGLREGDGGGGEREGRRGAGGRVHGWLCGTRRFHDLLISQEKTTGLWKTKVDSSKIIDILQDNFSIIYLWYKFLINFNALSKQKIAKKLYFLFSLKIPYLFH